MPYRPPRYVHSTGFFNRLAAHWRSRIGAHQAWAAGILAGAMLAAAPNAMAQPAAAAPLPLRLMVIGDSLTAGFGLPLEQSFPSQLQAALRRKGHNVTVLNAGVSGDTTAGGKARLGWALADKPDAVILELGANDGLRGIDPKDIHANLSAMLTTLKARGIPVFLSGMFAPPNLGDAYGKEFRAVYTRLAREFDVPLQTFFLDGVVMKRELNQADGFHPNAAGVAVIVEKILPQLEPWLSAMGRPAPQANR